jgi:hypothetical protein
MDPSFWLLPLSPGKRPKVRPFILICPNLTYILFRGIGGVNCQGCRKGRPCYLEGPDIFGSSSGSLFFLCIPCYPGCRQGRSPNEVENSYTFPHYGRFARSRILCSQIWRGWNRCAKVSIVTPRDAASGLTWSLQISTPSGHCIDPWTRETARKTQGDASRITKGGLRDD